MDQDWTFDDLLRQGLLLAAAMDAEDSDRDAEIEFSQKYRWCHEVFAMEGSMW